MKQLKNPRIAAVVTAAAVLCSILFGTVFSLVKEYRPVKEYFFDGSQDGFSVNNDLETLAGNAANLITVSKRYIPDSVYAKKLTQQKQALLETSDPNQKMELYRELLPVIKQLYDEMGAAELTEEDQQYRNEIYSDIKAGADVLSRDPYNSMAKEFNQKRSCFPAKIFAGLFGIQEADTFDTKL